MADGGTVVSTPVRKRSFTVRDIADRSRAFDHIRGLSLDRAYQITVEPYRKRRSSNANALYWQWVAVAGADLGYDKEDMHEALKEACDCPVYEYTTLDGEVRQRRSTAKLDSGEMSAFMDRVYRLLVIDHGIRLPIPEAAHAGG